MVIRNIKDKMIIKNYKELCSTLDEPIKSGKSKILQLKDWERYFKYHKDGNKFIIDEIYEKPLPKENYGNNSKYVEEIQDILVDYIYKNSNEKNEIILSFSKLINILGLVNNTYTTANRKMKELSEILNIEMEAIYYFYNNTRSEFKNIIERALTNLIKRSVIEVNDTYEIVEKSKDKIGEKFYREATTEERGLIIDAKNTVLKYLDLNNLRELYLAGNSKYREFNKLVQDELPKEWLFFYPAYKIIVGKNAIRREYALVQQKKKQLNEKSIARMTSHLQVIDNQSNESKLIDKLISLINYDFELDNKINELYDKHRDDYYKKLIDKGKQLSNVKNKQKDIENDMFKITLDYETRNDIDEQNYLNYSNKIKYKKKMVNKFGTGYEDEFERLFG